METEAECKSRPEWQHGCSLGEFGEYGSNCMGVSDSKSPAALGFLTVLEHEAGLTGGYLLLNTLGRPLEFHCTAPIKPNRAQQILFGPTLEPYLYGEQIGQTLIGKGSVEPLVVYTDMQPVLNVRDFVSSPVALVVSGRDRVEASDRQAAQWRLDAAHTSENMNQFSVGINRLAVKAARAGDEQEILDRLRAHAPFDFSEPFGRIRGAVEEALRGAK